ncbi:glycyl-radical enzyme activating protein [Pleomorphochaeta sp. DL1XJH-081]|uniref:glycyl-radical enzyme activating protein n=1 Tax=Pleomorphochaeta sp. DL1XJH-081 TaxID=3409690 RepID=UPI003BB4D09A
MIGRYSHIQRFSTKDGPGIRTTVFMKGCNLDCRWCHNPETIPYRRLLHYTTSACVHCGSCARVCPTGATTMKDGKRQFDHTLCDGCGKCVDVCRVDALGLSGTDISAKSLANLLLRDYDYYLDSHGGVTFSGGEPFLQADFLLQVSTFLKEKNVSIAIDTAFNIPWSTMEPLLAMTDLLLIDIKSMDRENHYRCTGVYPDFIWQNYRKLEGTDIPFLVRMPLISGMNDSDQEIDLACRFLQGRSNLVGVEILPYHDLGVDKTKTYQGSVKEQEKFTTPTSERMWEIAEKFEKYGVPVLGTYGGGKI